MLFPTIQGFLVVILNIIYSRYYSASILNLLIPYSLFNISVGILISFLLYRIYDIGLDTRGNYNYFGNLFVIQAIQPILYIITHLISIWIIFLIYYLLFEIKF